MSVDFDSNAFYFYELPKYINLLKSNLSEKVKSKDSLISKDYIESFIEFFNDYNAFDYFKDIEIEKDELFLTISFRGINNQISIERNIRVKDIDETYEIILNLTFADLPIVDYSSYSYELMRDKYDRFSYYKSIQSGYKRINIKSFELMVFENKLLKDITYKEPSNISIILNSNF